MQSQTITLNRRWLIPGGIALLLAVVGVILTQGVASNEAVSWSEAQRLNEGVIGYDESIVGDNAEFYFSIPYQETQLALLPLQNLEAGQPCMFEVHTVSGKVFGNNPVQVIATGYDQNFFPNQFEVLPLDTIMPRMLQQEGPPTHWQGTIIADAGLGVTIKGEVYLIPTTKYANFCD